MLFIIYENLKKPEKKMGIIRKYEEDCGNWRNREMKIENKCDQCMIYIYMEIPINMTS